MGQFLFCSWREVGVGGGIFLFVAHCRLFLDSIGVETDLLHLKVYDFNVSHLLPSVSAQSATVFCDKLGKNKLRMKRLNLS